MVVTIKLERMYGGVVQDSYSLTGTERPGRLIKNIKHDWRIRFSGTYKPVKKGRDKERDTVTYTVEGVCGEATAAVLMGYAYSNNDFRFYSELAVLDPKGANGDSRTGSYDRIVITSCEIELLSGKHEQYMYTYRMAFEEARHPED